MGYVKTLLESHYMMLNSTHKGVTVLHNAYTSWRHILKPNSTHVLLHHGK